MNMARDLSLLAPEIAVMLTAVGALVFEMLRLPRLALPFTVVGLLVATGLTVPLIGTETTVFMGTFRVDPLGEWAKVALLPATALCAVLAHLEVRGTDREGTVHALFSLTALGALVLAGAGDPPFLVLLVLLSSPTSVGAFVLPAPADLMFVVLGVLLASLGSFALAAYPRDDRATEGAMKFLVFGSVTGAVMTFGLTYWYGTVGSTLLSELGGLGDAPFGAAAGLVAVLVGLGYKAAIAPFHFWAPDAYDGAPVSVAAFLSVVPKVGAIFGLVQVVRDLPAETGWPPVVAALAVLSMTYGNLAALVQDNVVRLLAYSSIAQSGYFLLGVVAFGESGLALPSLAAFAVAYAAMNVGAFAVVAGRGRYLRDLAGVGRHAPWTGGAMVVFLISLVGIPPTAGFAGKLLLFGAAIDSGYVWLAVIAILNSVLSLAVYLRVVIPMYGTPKEARAAELPTAAVRVVALVLVLAVGIAALGTLGGIA